MSIITFPSPSSIKAVRDWALRKPSINPDLMGLGSLVSDKFFDLKHSDKKVLGLSMIAVAIGMYRPWIFST